MSEKENKKELNFIPLAEAARLSGYTPEHLNLLCRTKRIKAEKIGRNWFTTEEWLDEFIAVVELNNKKAVDIKEEFKRGPVGVMTHKNKEKTIADDYRENSRNKVSVPATDLHSERGDNSGKELVDEVEYVKESSRKIKWSRGLTVLMSSVLTVFILFMGVHVLKNVYGVQIGEGINH
ncbi:MAG TPA: hypothetical protein ENG89_02175, partial [Candidatus Moranbacteria bacterium]|nr:hypothetical protein [Candidatus Moranbacteria bacterium]